MNKTTSSLKTPRTPSPFTPTAQEISDRATRYLARHAARVGLLDPTTLEFILDNPRRAGECTEWVDFLSGSEDQEEARRVEANRKLNRTLSHGRTR